MGSANNDYLAHYAGQLPAATLAGDNPMRKNEARKIAERAFLDDRGRITNKEIAQKLGIHPATVARWKKLDEWDVKLVQSLSKFSEGEAKSEDFFAVDLRHLSLLNERIDAYLRKKELLNVDNYSSMAHTP